MAAPHLPTSLHDAKREMRAAARAARAGHDPALGAALTAHILPTIAPGAIVGGYWPLPGEIDIRPVLEALHRAGHALALPRTPPRGQPLSFHAWQPGAILCPGRFGTLEPGGPAVAPSLLLVPLLAFDRRGQRLGYGAGYYDRTIAGWPGIRTIGCAFAAQEVAAVPCGPTDQPLGAIATERGLLLLRT